MNEKRNLFNKKSYWLKINTILRRTKPYAGIYEITYKNVREFVRAFFWEEGL